MSVWIMCKCVSASEYVAALTNIYMWHVVFVQWQKYMNNSKENCMGKSACKIGRGFFFLYKRNNSISKVAPSHTVCDNFSLPLQIVQYILYTFHCWKGLFDLFIFFKLDLRSSRVKIYYYIRLYVCRCFSLKLSQGRSS